MAQPKIAVVIPAFNAANSIDRLIYQVSLIIPKKDMVVVDDGSTDSTRSLVEATGVTCLCHGRNQGKGAALNTGFDWCLHRGYEGVITMDSDGQHQYAEIPRLIAAFVEHGFDLVVGSRAFSWRNMPLTRIITNTVSSKFISWLSHNRMLDSQSGFRLVTSRVLRTLTLESRRYDIESEMLIKATHHNFSIGWVPITTVYNGSRSYFHPWSDTCTVIKGIVVSFFWCWRQAKALA